MHNGDGNIVPLAVSVCNVENESNWRYFLSYLKVAVPTIDSNHVVITHDREIGLINAQNIELPNTVVQLTVYFTWKRT